MQTDNIYYYIKYYVPHIMYTLCFNDWQHPVCTSITTHEDCIITQGYSIGDRLFQFPLQSHGTMVVYAVHCWTKYFYMDKWNYDCPFLNHPIFHVRVKAGETSQGFKPVSIRSPFPLPQTKSYSC